MPRIPATFRSNRKRDRSHRQKRPKKSLIQRLLEPPRQIAALVLLLFTNPRAFPAAFHDTFRRGFRTVWKARGGGLYAVGFFLTFLWLEIRMFVGDVTEASGVGDYVSQQLIELIMRFTVESVMNTVQALLWPLTLIGLRPPVGLLVLVVMYILFPLTLKKPIERWLIADAEPLSDPDERTDADDENA